MNSKHPCRHLRSKSMYIPALATQASEEPGDETSNSPCWCNATLTETGPDDLPVGQQVCRPGRSCFEE